MNDKVKRAIGAYNIKADSYNTKNKKVLEALDLYDKRRKLAAEDELKSLSEQMASELETYNTFSDSEATHGWGSNAAKDVLDSTLQSRLNIDKMRSQIEAYRDIIGGSKSDEWIAALDTMTKGYQSRIDYANQFSQFETEDDYNKYRYGWLTDDENFVDSDENVKGRQDIYEANKKRISEIDSLLPSATGDNKKKLKAEREGLIAENNQYERGQKSVDTYYDIKNQDGFGESKKDYNNPTEEDYITADIRNDSTSWYTTGNGAETKNSLGEIVIKADGTPGDNYTVENGEIKAKTSPVTVDRLGLYNAAKNSGYTYVPVGMEGSYDKIVKDGNDASWDQLTPDEENIYYWLLENNGQKDADNYLDSMTATLNRRAMQEMSDYIDNADTLERIALNIASVPASVFGGISGFIEDTANTVSGKEINPYSPAHSFKNFSSEVRSNTAQKIDEALDGAAIPLIDFSVGDAYQALMSTADSALGATLGGTGYGILMGMSSATSEARRLYEAGATNGQILWGGLLSGAAEMVFEKVSLDHFLKEGVPENIKGIIKNVLAQGGVEASEEAFTEIANTISNTLVMRSQSDWAKTVQSYIDEGYSKSEANKYAFLGTLKDVVNAGLGGFISGGLHSGISSTIAYNTQTVPMRNEYANHIIENKSLPTLMDIAKSMVEAKDEALSKGDLKRLDKLANKADTKGGNKNIGALAMRVNNLSQTVRTADIKQQLTELGVDSKKAGKYAEVINKALNRELTDDDIDLYQEAVGSKEGSQVFEEMLQSMDNPVTSYFADAIGQQTPFSGKYDNYQTAKKFADEKAELEAKATDIPNSTTITETPEITASDVNSDIETDDDRSEAALNNAIKEIDVDIDDSSLQIIKSEYDGSMPVAQFAKGMADGYKFGYSGVPQSAISDSEFYSTLSDKQKDHAYRLGAAAAKAKSEQADAEIKKEFNGKTGRRKGTVKGEGVKIADLKKTFNDTQNKAYKVLSTVSEATGVDIVLYKSTVNEAGEFVENQGKFKYKDNTIYIDINAGLLNEMDVNELGKYTMLRTFTHEFVHFIEKWNPVEYNAFRKLVFEELTNRGEKVDDLIEDKMSLTEGMSYDKASREVVAEAMTDMLPDSNFIQKIAESNPNVFKKLLEKLKEFLNEIKDYFNSIGHNRSIEANALKEERDGQIHYLESIIKAFDKVAEGAVNNYQRTFGTDEVVTENATTETATNTEAKEQTKETSEPNITTSEYGYTVTDNPEQRIIEVKFDEKPSREIRDVLKNNRFWFNRERSVWQRNGGWYNTNAKDTVTEALDNAYKAESNSAVESDVKSTVSNANTKTIEIAQKIVKQTLKREETSAISFGDSYYMGNTAVIAAVDKATYDSVKVDIKADNATHIGNMMNNPKLVKFNGNAYSYLLGSNGSQTKTVLLDSGETQIILKEKYAKYFDGYYFYYVPGNYKAGCVIRDSNGSNIGIIMPMINKDIINTEKLELSKMRSFSNKKSTKNINSEVKENVKETDNSRTVSQTDTNGEGTPRLLDESQTSDVSGTGEERKSVEPTSERGTEVGRDGDRTDTSDRDSRSEGNGEGGDLRGNDVVTEEVKEAKNKELKETVNEQVEQKSTETPKGKNFTIGDSLNLPDGEKTRFRANIDAIKLVKQLEAEGRYATAAEQEVLSKYVGWGGLSNAFGEMKYNYDTRKSEMTAKKGWEAEFAEFRKLVEDGIITEDEYKAASASTKNAHYTSIEVIKAMYDGLSQLGFKGGRMLEPSSGVGNFVGAMPSSMSSKVNSWTMVELDSITGLIAKYLYPNADVRIQGFEKANIPDNYMDVAIGNVPFGNYGVVDRSYPKRVTKAIHNYFFAKSLDKVRPGGIVMYITSSFTMNSQGNEIRQYIMDRADLLGAIRLPNNAFSGNAGTQVVTDILILKKRKAGTEYSGESFLEAPYQKIDENSWQGANINEYFTNHPEMVLGTPALARGMYGAESLTYNPLEGKGALGEQIREAFKNITVKMDYDTKPSAEKANFNAQRADRKTKESGLVANEDGTISQRQDGKLVKYNTDAATAKRIAGILSIRDAYKTLVAYLQQGQAENLIKKARKDLNTAYDKFVKEYGYLNSTKNKSAIEADPDRYSIFALENYDAKSKTATKADIFTKDTIKPNRTITHVDDIESGVIVSINTTGGVDPALIAKLTDKTEDEVTRELIDGRYAFKTKDGSLEAPETYLAGNVRAKLREAEALAPIDPDFNNNVEELKKVIPKDIPFNDIYVTPGSPWIPTEVYADFIAEMLGGYNNPNSYSGPDVTVGRSNQTGEFKIVINNKRLKSRYQNTQQWGTKRRSFIDLITAMMSSTSITVNDYIEDASGKKKPVINKVETAAAQAKAEEIAKEFQDWIWRDENRRKELASLYNETYNALVTPKYSGKNLTINGLNADFTLREHQANAVQRIIASGGNTLLAHKVGAGKTLEMAAAAMKLRELGIVKKPIFAVPKSLVAQWGVEFKSYFPAAKLLVADEKSFSKANRKVFSNTIANGDFDAVIVSYEQFEKIPMSVEYQKKFYQQQIDEIIAAIAEEKAETKGKGITVKEMEKKRAQLEKKIAELTTKAKDEDNIDFEQLGIDSLFVDEAHNFKNLQYVTRMNNISGLGNTNGSQRAFDLYTKIRYLQGLNGGRGIVFATATPVMNSMAEMYIMQKYLQSDMLNQLGLSTFDAWAKQFGEVVNAVEIKPSGQGFRVKQTFSNFRNLNELQLLFRSFSDVLTTVPGLKIPKMKGGKVQTVVCEPGQFQKDYMAELEKRADNIKNVDASVDNMLKITSDGRKVSYTQRMIDPSLPYEPGCKIYRCCDNVLEEYKNSKSIKGTQIIFCDMATPKGKSKTANASTEVTDDTEFDVESARLYDDMRSYLVKKGIPAKEIAFIHEADTDSKKKQLFADVNDGKVRVLIGSTGKMGVGMNAQKRIVAIHHLDAPWRPGDVEQRDGRAFRQKNMNEEVTKYTYVTEGSFDARLWDILDRKQHFINQIMNGEDVGRTAEDTGDVTLSAAEVKALASGNPLIMEQVQLSTDLQKLEDLQRAYKSSIATAKAKMLDDKQKIAYTTKSIENCRKDIKARENTYTENKFSMTVEGKKFSDMKEAGAALIAAITSKANTEAFTTIGKFAGFELKVIKQGPEYAGIISGEQGYKFDVHIGNTTHMVKKICSVVEGLEYKLKDWETSLSELKADLAAQEKMIDEPFSKQEELEQKRRRFNEIMAVLNPSDEQQISDDENDQAQSRKYLDEDIEETLSPNQSRTGTLTDREILEYAYDELDAKDFTEGEKASLEVFGKRLGNLRDLQEKRAELGRLYKEQQFGANVDRSAAAETLNRMRILDSQISKASSELLSVEEKEVLKRVLKKSRGIIEKNERAQAKERLDRWRERRRESDAIKKYRVKIKADVDELSKWVLKPDNKNALKHIPDALKNTVIPFLTSIDFTSKRQLKGGEATKADKAFVEKLTALKAAMKKNIDINGMYSGYNDLPPNFMDSLQNFIDATKALVEKNSGEFVINKMTGAELKELSKIVRNLKKFITQMNLFHSNAMFKHVYEAGDNSLYYLKSIGDAGGKTGNVSNYLLWQNMRPAYAFERFGEGGQAIYDEFRRAQATLAFNSKAIIDFTDKNYTEAEIKAWEKEEKVFELGGDEVHIPVSFIMSFYELSKQPDSLRHILGEGIRVATYKNGKVKISDNGHTLTGEDVRTIISSLSERQIEVADALQKYMATQGAEWGNYVSLARFGEELFTNPQYFPINSDGRHLDSTVEEHPSNASLYALLNMSFTKQRNEEANNRIILYSIFDVFANHMASMAQYNAFALPVLDAIKWFNYKETTVDNETGKKVTLGSVREEMSRVYGVPEESRPGSGREGYAETFVKNIIRAYNGTETQGISTDTFGLKALRQYNMSQIAYNFRVVVQQPLAITRAGLLIDYSSILKGLKASPSEIKANINEMYKHSGIAAWKSLGFYDINISRGLTDMIKHNSTAIDKINEIGMWGAEKADIITWSAIWSACKLEVSKKQNVRYGTPEYFEAATKLFEDVIYKTQVVDSVLTKTEFMRSKGFFSRAISSFMSEPVTTASMAISAYDKYQTDIQRGMSRQQAWQRNGKLIGRTCAVYSISAILLAAVQAVIDAWRDDDEDESYLEKYLNAFTGNVIDELMPFNKLPVASDFYDLAKELASIFGVDTYGNPPQSVFMQWYDSLVKGTEILYKKISGQNSGYTWYAGIAKMLKAVSGITGLPISTATREVIDAWNNTAGALNEKLKVEKYVSNADSTGSMGSDEYINHIENGDKTAANEYYASWIDSKKEEIKAAREKDGKTELSEKELEKEAKSRIKSSVSSKFKEKYVEAYKTKDNEAMSTIRKQMRDTGLYGSVDDIIKICRGWVADYKKPQ